MARPGGQPAGPPRQPPISFKTVPGRNRTQKWNQAKQYNYDGDDWGGYDPYDEYGGPEDSDPPAQGIQRQQSFETGAERRQFSAGAYDRSGSPAKSIGSDRGGRQREYSNPGQVPPPLSTRVAPAEAAQPASPQDAKPLPFIRPSDIYKRMAEEKEKERQSFESSRPSMDSIHREGTPASVSSGQRPLSTVQERPGSGDVSALLQSDTTDLHPGYGARPTLPPVGQVSDFGDDVLQANVPPTREQPALQDIVTTAFDRQHSTASSVYSQQTGGNVSRSNTDSTSAISPIMSRIPSTAATQQRHHDRELVPPIEEEPASGHSRSVSGETIVPPTHSNFASLDAAAAPASENPYRRSLNASSPAPSGSPARTPAVESADSKRLSGPMAAEIAAEPAVGRPRAGTDYSVREADLAQEASAQPAVQNTDIAQAQHEVQNDFLNEHTPARADVAQPPQPSRLASFQPHMPGEWISPAVTPAVEKAQPVVQPPSRLAQTASVDDEVPDFSPTTSHGPKQDDAVSSAISAVKDAGSALGAALLSTAGLGHQTKDFGSETPQPVSQPEPHARNQTGDITARLPLHRVVSDAPTESNASVISDVPPTPPAKDISAPKTYFEPAAKPEATSPQSARTLSGEYESDRLSKDIMQSLGPTPVTQIEHSAGRTLTDSTPVARAPAGRPGLLDQRFSWESSLTTQTTRESIVAANVPPPAGSQTAEPVIAPMPVAPAVPMAVVGELPHDKDRQSFERPPDGQALHIVNAQKDELVSPISPIQEERSPVSPLQPQPAFQTLDVPTAEGIPRNELSPSPVSMNESSHIPSYYAGVTDSNFEAAVTPELQQEADAAAEEAAPLSTSEPIPPINTNRQSGRIPPFREILAMKEAPERIKTYTETRHTFAEMNTGLNVWMNGLLAKYPEHSNMVNDRGGFNTDTIQHDGSMGRGHRHNPSILKLNPFNVNDSAPDTPPKDYSDSRQMEKMQAKGKDLMKSASAFGGKAQAGAMGLLAKGRNRLRGDKAKSPPPQQPTPARRSSRPLSSEILTAELARELTGSNHAATFGEPNSSEAKPATTEHERNGITTAQTNDDRKSGFFAKLRRRSRSLTRLPRPSSTILVADDELALQKTRTASRSRSRPQSLVLLRSNRSDDARSHDVTAQETSIPALPSTPAPLTKTRTEAWENADALPRLSEANEDGRLGVLPSPSTFVFTEHASSPQRQRKNSLVTRNADMGGADDEGRPNTSGSVVRHLPPVEDASPRMGEEKPLPPPPPTELRHKRRSSDLSTLPSQLRANDVAPVPSWERSGSPVLDPATKRYSFPLQAALLEHEGESAIIDDEPKDNAVATRSHQNDAVAGAQDERPPTTIAAPTDMSTASEHISQPVQTASPAKEDEQKFLRAAMITAPVVANDVVKADDVDPSQVASQASAAQVLRPEDTHDVDDDQRSFVSARDEAAVADDKHSIKSQRSAVSSIGKLEDVSTAPAATTSHAQRPGLTSPMESYSTVFRPLDQLDLRPVQQAVELSPNLEQQARRPPIAAERPLSYLPMPRDALGQPLQESIERAQAPSTTDVAKPDHTSRQSNVHPLLRDNSGGRAIDAATPMGGRNESKPRLSASVFPSSSQIDDQYGLEGAQQATIVEDSHHDEIDNKRTKRRSGLWETLRKVSSSGPRPAEDEVRNSDPRRRSVVDMLGRTNDSNGKVNTLKKPQRSASVAVDAPKKRFSGFGSLFGRSNPTPTSVKPNKLAKRATAPVESTPEYPMQGYYSQPAAANYQDYEASLRKQSAYEEQQSSYAAAPSRRPQQQSRTQSATLPAAPSQSSGVHEYYGSEKSKSTYGRPAPSNAPSYVLQNEWYYNGQTGNRPEAFRPSQTTSTRPTAVPEQNGSRTTSTGEVARSNWPLRGESMRQIPSTEQFNVSHVHSQDYDNSQISSPVSTMHQDGRSSQVSMPFTRSSQDQHSEYNGQRAYAEQQRPWQVSLPSRTPVHARTSESYSALPTLQSMPHTDRPDSSGGVRVIGAGYAGPQQPSSIYADTTPYGYGSTTLPRHIRTNYEPQMRGSSYPGQEWMPSVHGHT